MVPVPLQRDYAGKCENVFIPPISAGLETLSSQREHMFSFLSKENKSNNNLCVPCVPLRWVLLLAGLKTLSGSPLKSPFLGVVVDIQFPDNSHQKVLIWQKTVQIFQFFSWITWHLECYSESGQLLRARPRTRVVRRFLWTQAVNARPKHPQEQSLKIKNPALFPSNGVFVCRRPFLFL